MKKQEYLQPTINKKKEKQTEQIPEKKLKTEEPEKK